MGGGGVGYIPPATLARVAVTLDGKGGFHDVAANFAKPIGKAADLDTAVKYASELSRGSSNPGVAVLPHGDAFTLFPVSVTSVPHSDDRGRAVALEGNGALASASFAGPQLAALVDGASVVKDFDRAPDAGGGLLGPLPTVYRKTGDRPYSSWRVDASLVEHTFGFSALADAVTAARSLSSSDRSAVGVLEADGYFHLHGLTETTRVSNGFDKPPTVTGPSPLRLSPDFAKQPVRDNAYPIGRRVAAFVDGDLVFTPASRTYRDGGYDITFREGLPTA